MYNNSTKGRKRDNRDGKNRFGTHDFKKRHSGGHDNFKPMHPATCEKCGMRCEVPFKPNGKKPVFCSNCFVKDTDRGSYDRDFRPSRTERPSFDRSPDIGDQLKKINTKLDAILRIMEG